MPLGITIATSVRYGNYKEHHQNALSFAKVAAAYYEDIKQFIKLPKNVFLHLRPMRDAYGRAFYAKSENTTHGKIYVIELDVRQSFDLFKNTLIHELVHIEQFYQGRLKDAGPMHFKWNGKKTLIDTSTLDVYNNLPWEVEANIRAELLSCVVFN